MIIVDVTEKLITGVSIETINSDEKKPETAKIGTLWGTFNEKILPFVEEKESVFGVYYDYESDYMGKFKVMAGLNNMKKTEDISSKQVTIQKGQYMIFKATGNQPKAIIDTWSKVWDYFLINGIGYKRIYTTDFEHYVNPNLVNIYIAIQQDYA